MTTCPNCRAKIESTAIVAAFLDDPQWSFWGVEGCRWIVCRGAGYVHFRVQIDGRTYHRLAQITRAAQVPTRATWTRAGRLVGILRSESCLST